MPSSSMRLTSEASEKRGGGSVQCWGTARSLRFRASPSLRAESGGPSGVAIILADHLARRRNRRIVDLHAVGSHIGNETGGLAADIDALVEPLRDPHGVCRRKTELAAGFLLQGRSGEGGLRIAPRRFCLDRGNREAGGLDRLLEVFGFRAGADVEPLDLLAVAAHQPRLERFPTRRRP